MKLLFIRHGQTDWNVKGKIQGSYDSELNDIGIAQAEQLSQKVIEQKYKFSKIYSSEQKRAHGTAQILSEHTKVECIVIDGLEEINLGEWEGLSWKEVEEKYPLEYSEWYNNRRYIRPPKGETYQEMLERVLKALHKIVYENSEDVAIVTHSAVIMTLQCYVTNTSFNDMLKFTVENTSITEVDGDLFLEELICN